MRRIKLIFLLGIVFCLAGCPDKSKEKQAELLINAILGDWEGYNNTGKLSLSFNKYEGFSMEMEVLNAPKQSGAVPIKFTLSGVYKIDHDIVTFYDVSLLNFENIPPDFTYVLKPAKISIRDGGRLLHFQSCFFFSADETVKSYLTEPFHFDQGLYTVLKNKDDTEPSNGMTYYTYGFAEKWMDLTFTEKVTVFNADKTVRDIRENTEYLRYTYSYPMLRIVQEKGRFMETKQLWQVSYNDGLMIWSVPDEKWNMRKL